MSKPRTNFALEVEETPGLCPTGETVGRQMIADKRIPVISCEGGCIRGEIARLAANLVAKTGPYARGCHGEMFTVPRSAMAEWAEKADNVVVIDGCFMACHGRVMKNLVGEAKVLHFDALSFYNKYTELMDIDDVPEAERRSVARHVADEVLLALKQGST